MKFSKRLVVAAILLICLSGCSKSVPNDVPPDNDTPSDNDTSVTMYTTQDVNMREGAGIDNAIIEVIPRSESVKVFLTADGWSKIKYNDREGYVKTAFLSKEKPLSYEQRASEIIKTMTIEEKVGQMFFVRCRKDTAVTDLKKYHLGGYILFDANIKGQTKNTLKAVLQGYQNDSRIKMLIGIDEEGGTINRLSKYDQFRKVPFHSPQDLYAEGGLSLIASDTKEKAALLKSLGINVNLAPVSDVSTNAADYIYARSFGKDAAETAKYVKTVVETMNANNMGSTLKHFPGYGNNADTHTGIAIDNRSYDSFVKSDFVPFSAGIKAGAGSILVSHNIVNCMDEDLPASLSPAVHKILRDDLEFDGVIMTDDLKMDAIKKYIGDDVSAVLAIKAGNDLLIASDFDVQIPSVLKAVENGTITEDRIDESLFRILRWKLQLGIIK